jgi:hypothetical protein
MNYLYITSKSKLTPMTAGGNKIYYLGESHPGFCFKFLLSIS